MTRGPDRFLQTTIALLVASFALIAPSLVGLPASLPLAIALVLLAGGLFALRDHGARAGWIGGVPVGAYLRVAWVGPLLAAAVVLLALGATAGELQALGGLCGLLGMANYFLRPVYGIATSIGRLLRRSLS